MFIAKMEWQNKTKCFFIKHLDANTAERLWVDQGAAKEFVQHQHYLASKYHGKILNFEIADVDISV